MNQFLIIVIIFQKEIHINGNNKDDKSEDFLSQNLCIGKENKKSTLDKYHHNLSVLEYLKNNKEISRKSNFNNIKNMKLYEIYDEYLNSKEFKMDISKLKQQKETDKYIKKYISRAINLIDYFYY